MESLQQACARSGPFAGCSGRDVRIAVVDTGVNARHPHIASIAGGYSIEGDPTDFTDYLGHGTAVTAAMQEHAPAAEYFAVKLFQDSLRTTIDSLCQAIEWALAQRVDVINLSLGTRNAAHAGRLSALVSQATNNGILIVAARSAEDQLCYPGSLPGVISVGLDWNLPRESYRYEETDGDAVFYASGYPRSLPGLTPQRNLNGISFAVANMTGFVARACEGTPDRSLANISVKLAAEASYFAGTVT
jgi:subtilisin family serine protease